MQISSLPVLPASVRIIRAKEKIYKALAQAEENFRGRQDEQALLVLPVADMKRKVAGALDLLEKILNKCN